MWEATESDPITRDYWDIGRQRNLQTSEQLFERCMYNYQILL